MMRKYCVTYDLSTNPDPKPGAAFEGMSTQSNLVMEVMAAYPDQACQIVRAMFGGQLRCWTKCAFEMRDR